MSADLKNEDNPKWSHGDLESVVFAYFSKEIDEKVFWPFVTEMQVSYAKEKY